MLPAVGLVFFYGRFTQPSPEKLVAEAGRQLDRGQFAKAENLARQALARRPHDGSALRVAADAAIELGHPDAALEYYLQIPDDCSAAAVSGRFRAGEVLVDLGRLFDAEQKFRRALACDPDHRESHLRLAHLLGITGRRWESVAHMLAVVHSGRFPGEHLLMLGDVERVANERRMLTRCRQAAPDDPLPKLGLARVALVENDLPEARRLLEQVVAVLPNENEAQAQLGSVLLESGSAEEFLDWLARLPPSADRHPEAWVVRGRWCLEQNDSRAAARCFWEAVRRDPDHRQANYRLGLALAALNDPALNEPGQASPFLKRAEKLEELTILVDDLFRNNHDKESMRKASVLAEALSRVWEAWGWARLAQAEDPAADWAQQTIARLAPLLRPDTPRTLPEGEPARLIDLSSYSLPDWQSFRELTARRPRDEAPAVQVRFADVAAEAGIEFVYFNSPDPNSRATRIFQTTGGGVAALDFDGDSWPDLYFTQGCRWPPGEEQGEHRDRMFRNLFVANDGTANFYFVNQTDQHNGRLKFEERALSVGLAFDADGLLQACMGVAAGDADGNGLLDLFVTNFYNESDTLYLQQTGGLFIDMTRQAGLRESSLVPLGFGTQFLDGDLDGLPDLVLTNGHVDDLSDVGQPYEMSPQYYRNLGQARFVELEASSLGQFFEGTYLGRGLARLDWNRDGKEDFAVSHIGSAAALVVNRTAGAGHFVALQFRGVDSARDAIGTTVRVTAAGKTWINQLTAGDGFQASNQRRLVFGLGSATLVEKLVVRWPAGIEQTFTDVSADADFILIEGRNDLVRVP